MSVKKYALLLFTVIFSACSEPEPSQVAPPAGLHIGWPVEAWGEVEGVKFEVDESKRILDRIKEENIQTKLMTYYGDKYLVWEEKDDETVRKIINNRN